MFEIFCICFCVNIIQLDIRSLEFPRIKNLPHNRYNKTTDWHHRVEENNNVVLKNTRVSQKLCNIESYFTFHVFQHLFTRPSL